MCRAGQGPQEFVPQGYGLGEKEFFPGNNSPARAARDGGGFSPGFSLASGFKGFPVPCLEQLHENEAEPRFGSLDVLGLLSKDSPSSKSQRLEKHPWTR